jgi:hypothetical protein
MDGNYFVHPKKNKTLFRFRQQTAKVILQISDKIWRKCLIFVRIDKSFEARNNKYTVVSFWFERHY